ncbi:hypothetical protein EsH8_VI_000427 [Colletotrichum jinshuiense]
MGSSQAPATTESRSWVRARHKFHEVRDWGKQRRIKVSGIKKAPSISLRPSTPLLLKTVMDQDPHTLKTSVIPRADPQGIENPCPAIADGAIASWI